MPVKLRQTTIGLRDRTARFGRSMIFLGLTAALSACGGSTPSPTAPGPKGVVLSGTYAGSASDSTGAGTMSWTVAQSAGSVSGSVTASTAAGTAGFTGTISGTLTDTTLTFTITVPQGGILGFPGCSATLAGSATGVSNTTIPGTYTGTNSCSGAFAAGVFNLVKQ